MTAAEALTSTPGPLMPTPPPPPEPELPPEVVPEPVIQVSPWRDPDHGILLTFTLEGEDTPLVRVMVTNQNPNLAGSRYALDTEYWHAARESPRGRRLFMSFSHGPWTVEEVDRFLVDLPLCFSALQDAKGLWRSTPVTPPGGLVRRCFTAQDPDTPDDPATRIGLMLVFDPNLGLCQAVWYKSNEPPTGYVWHDGTSPTAGLVWTPEESLAALPWSFAQGRQQPPR